LGGRGFPSRPTLGLAKPTAEGWFRWTSCGFGLAAHPPLLRRCPSRKEKRQAGASRPVTPCSCAGVPSLRGNLPVPPRPFASAAPPFRRNGRPGAVGPDARKASPQRRGVLDVRRRRRRAKPDKADGPTPPALPRIEGGAFKLAQEGAPSEAGQKRKGRGEKSPARKACPLVGLLEPWPTRLLSAAMRRRAFAPFVGNLAPKLPDSYVQSPAIITSIIAEKIILDSSVRG